MVSGTGAEPMTVRLAAHTVGVMGSGTDEYVDSANAIGRLLASLEVNLLTGGGGGVMTSVSRAYVAHRRGAGICIGVIPCASESDRATSKAGYPNPFVELAIRTHLPYSGALGTHDLSRNHINVLSCDAIVALPGGDGTASELALAVRYHKPIVVYAPDLQSVDHLPVDALRAGRIDDVERFLRGHLVDRR